MSHHQRFTDKVCRLITEIANKWFGYNFYTLEGMVLDWGQSICYAQYGPDWNRITSLPGYQDANADSVKIAKEILENPQKYMILIEDKKLWVKDHMKKTGKILPPIGENMEFL